MPRQIIDTQTSRPSYVRRRAIRAMVVVLILALLASLALFFIERHRGLASSSALSVGETGRSFQETRRVNAEPGSPSHPRRLHAA
jgi:hypothetical protein